MVKKFGLRTKNVHGYLIFQIKLKFPEICDALPRSSNKEHNSLVRTSSLLHKSHSEEQNTNQQYRKKFGYRMSKLAEEKIGFALAQ